MEEPSAPGVKSPGSNGLEHLELRVRRLEDVVAAMQDTHQLEDRLAERVAERMHQQPPTARPAPALVIEAGRRLLGYSPNGAPPPLLIWEIYRDARTMVGMFFDRRFRMTWWGRIMPVVLLAMIFTSWLWLPGTGVLSTFKLDWLLVKPVDLVLAFVLYKILSREVRRYRALFPDSAA